jgi:hypothetical protein
MNEYERTFVSDCREKKQIAHSASHVKRGSRSRACSLPSDALTPSQLKKMSGKCAVYSLDKVYSYKDFKKLPVDFQADYLNHWMERFGVSLSTLGQHFWQLSPTTLSVHAKRVGISKKIKRKQGARIDPGTAEAIRKVVESSLGGRCAAEEDAQIEKVPYLQTDQLADTPVISARIELNRFDFDAVKILANMFAGKRVTVTIDVQEVENGE